MTGNQFTPGVAESHMFYALLALWFYNSVLVINREIFAFHFDFLPHCSVTAEKYKRFTFYRLFNSMIEKV